MQSKVALLSDLTDRIRIGIKSTGNYSSVRAISDYLRQITVAIFFPTAEISLNGFDSEMFVTSGCIQCNPGSYYVSCRFLRSYTPCKEGSRASTELQFESRGRGHILTRS
jgi:hypothetical protein